MANLNDIATKIEASRKILQQKYTSTRTLWQDRIGQGFEKSHFAPLANQIKLVQHELTRLSEIIERAKRDVK